MAGVGDAVSPWASLALIPGLIRRVKFSSYQESLEAGRKYGIKGHLSQAM